MRKIKTRSCISMSEAKAKENIVFRDFLSSDGELGGMIRTFNWSQTPLGSIELWSQSLKTTVNLMLNSTNPIWMGWGPENTFLYNDAYIEVLGIDKHGWALGKPASVVWEEIWDFCGPLSDKVYSESKSSSVTDSELFMKRGNFLEETFFSFTYSPVFDESGKVGGLFCANFETTDKILSARRSKTLAELSSKSLIEKTIQSACATVAETLEKNSADIPFAVIYLLDKNGSKAEIIQRVGLTDDTEFILPSLVDLDDAESVAANPVMKEIVTKVKSVVTTVKSPDIFPKGLAGQPVTETIGIPLTLSGRPLGVIIFGINPTRKLDKEYSTFFEMAAAQVSTAIQNATAIETERKRLEDLAELDKAKTVFFSNISHEFRTPLTLMLGPLEDLMGNHNLGRDEKEIVRTTHRNALRLLKLVNTLLDFSLMESGRMKAKFVPTDLASLTENLSGSFRSIIEKAGMELLVNVRPLSKDVYVDRQMWEKIVFNLLSNAFKYTLKGKITVEVTQNHGNAIFKVADTGLGIPEKELGNMFTRFHRIEGSTGRSYEGSGIGLSMIRELVSQHGGTISVESTEGKGSTFTVTIPFGINHLPDSQIFETGSITEDAFSETFLQEAEFILGNTAEEKEVSERDDISKDVVLIVDDNADMRKHLTSIIEKQYRVLTASNGIEALEVVGRDMPTIILSDIMMPVMDGIELVKALKSSPSTELIPVVLLTARAGEESKIEGYETGADDYLVKPFSAKELVARLKSQIKTSKSRDHYRQQLKNLFMQAPMAVSILKGPNFIVELANDNILKLWGKTSISEVLNKPLGECLPEAVEQGFDKLLEQVYTSGKEYVHEETPFYNFTNGISELIYVKFIYQPFYEEDGTISGIIVLAHDVTQQVKARKKIEESENKFRQLILKAPTGIVILKGEELIVEMANDVYASIVGKTTDQLTGNSLMEVLPQLKDSSVRVSLLSVLNTGAVHSHTELPVPMEIDGIAGLHYYNSVYQPLYENNKITGVIAIVNEVTEQYINRKIKEKNDEDLKMILESIPHIALRAEPDGHITYYNKNFYEYSGLTFEEVTENNWNSLIHPDMVMEVSEAWRHAIENGEDYERAFMVKRASDQTYRWHLSRTIALRNEKGEITQWVGTLTDIHDQKIFSQKLEAMVNERTIMLNQSNTLLAEKNLELEESNKELESFNYIASHDLQEPLRKIRTFINMITDKGKDSPSFDGYLAKIDSSAHRMSQLINAVLAYSRLSSNEDQFQTVNLNDLLHQVLADYELAIMEKGVKVHYDTLPLLNCIPTQINQLFSNLFSNAVKYSRENPVVQIRYEEVTGNDIQNFKGADNEQRFAQISFIDNGIGFDEQYSQQIFKLFQRLHGKSEYTGTGIGLSICKKITDKHGGYIRAKSSPGEGAAFIVQLPFKQ